MADPILDPTIPQVYDPASEFAFSQLSEQSSPESLLGAGYQQGVYRQQEMPAPGPSVDDMVAKWGGYGGDKGYQPGDLTQPNMTVLDQVDQALSQQFLDPNFIAKHPNFPDPTGASSRGFNGDESINDYVDKAGKTYEDTMFGHGARAGDVATWVDGFKKRLKRGVTATVLHNLMGSQPRYQSEWEKQPFFGDIIAKNHERHVKQGWDAINAGKGDMNDYLQVAGDLSDQAYQENQPGWRKGVLGALSVAKPISEIGQLSGVAKFLAPGEGAGALARAFGGGAAFTAVQFPLSGAQDLLAGKPLGEVARDEFNQLGQNSMFAGMGLFGPKGSPPGLIKKGLDYAWDTVKMLAAGEVSKEALHGIGTSDQGSALLRLARPDQTNQERADNFREWFYKEGGPLAVLNVAMKAMHAGEAPKPKKLSDQMVREELERLAKQKEVMPPERRSVPSQPADIGQAPAPARQASAEPPAPASPNDYVQTDKGWFSRREAEAQGLLPKAGGAEPAATPSTAQPPPPEPRKPLADFSDDDVRGLAKQFGLDARGSRETLLKRLNDMDKGRTVASLESLSAPPAKVAEAPEPPTIAPEATEPPKVEPAAEEGETKPPEEGGEPVKAPETPTGPKPSPKPAGADWAAKYRDAAKKGLSDKNARGLADLHHPEGQHWQHSGTEFTPNEKGESEFTANGKKYVVEANKVYEDGGVRVRVRDAEGEKAKVVFKKNTDGTYGAEALESTETRGLARPMYDFMKEKFGDIKPGKEQTDAGRNFWRKNAMEGQSLEPAKPSLVERMRQRPGQAEIKAPEPLTQEPRPEAKGGTVPRSAVIAKLEAAGEQAKALKERLAKQEPETPPGAEPPSPRQAQDDWRKNVVRLHATAYLKTMGDAMRDPSPDNVIKAGNVLDRLDKMAKSRGLDTRAMIDKEMPELGSLLDAHHDVLKSWLENPEQIPHSQEVKDAIGLAQRSAPDPTSLRRGVEQSLSGATEAARTAPSPEELARRSGEAGAGPTEAAGGGEAGGAGAAGAAAGGRAPDSNVLRPLPPMIQGELNRLVASGERVTVADIKEALQEHYSPAEIKEALKQAGKFPEGVEGKIKRASLPGHPGQLEGMMRKWTTEQWVTGAIIQHENANAKAAEQSGAVPRGTAQEAIHSGTADGVSQANAEARPESVRGEEEPSAADLSARAGAPGTDPAGREPWDLIAGESGAVNLKALAKFFGFKEDEPTGIANAMAAKERQKARLPPVQQPSPVGHSYPELRDQVLQIARTDPTRIDRLVEELQKKSRPVTDLEDALLLHRENDVRNQYDDAAHKLVQAQASGDAMDLQGAQATERDVREKLRDITDVTKQVGTETARGLAARRMMVNRDFSLANMVMQWEAAKGRALTGAEHGQAAQQFHAIQDAGARQQAAESALAEEGGGHKSPLFPEMTKAQVAAEGAKDDWRRVVEADRQKNLPLGQRMEDLVDALRRAFVISNPKAMVKIIAASAERMITTPLEEAVGSVWNRIPGIAKISAMAPREGRGLNLEAEKMAAYDGLTQGLKDAWQTAKKGYSELDTLYGDTSKPRRPWLDWIGALHGAGKAPAARNELTRSFLKRIDAAAAEGKDTTSPASLMQFGMDAYRDSQAAKFQQQNWLAQGMKRFLRPGADAGMAERGLKAVGRLTLPVVTVPTNLIFEASKYAFGSITGSTSAGIALARGIEGLKPAQAESIMQQLKKGSLGVALLAAGYYLGPKVVGGFYRGKRKPDEPEAGSVAGAPAYTLHNPALEMLQMGSTFGEAATKEGIGEGAAKAILGLEEQIPIVRDIKDIGGKALSPNAKIRGRYFGEFAKSLAVPQLVQWLAGRLDTKETATSYANPLTGEVQRRNPKTVLQHVQEGLPGLRNLLPAR